MMKPFVLTCQILMVLISVFTESNSQVPIYRGNFSEIKKVLLDDLPQEKEAYSFSIRTPEKPENPSVSKYGTLEMVNLPVSNPGNLPNWIVKVESSDATSIDLSFTGVNLSEGSKIYIYNEDRNTVLGPIDMNSINRDLNGFSSITMSGSEI